MWQKVVRSVAFVTLYVDVMLVLGVLCSNVFPWVGCQAVFGYGKATIESAQSPDAAGAILTIAVWTCVLALGVLSKGKRPAKHVEWRDRFLGRERKRGQNDLLRK